MTPAELKTLRLSRGITAAHVAKKLGIARSYLGDMERGNRPMPQRYATAYLAAISHN